MIRDYRESDFEDVVRIHNESEINYRMPDLSEPLFLVKKVYEDEKGVIRAVVATRIECEFYLWLDRSKWGNPREKFEAIKELEKKVIYENWLQGIDCGVLYLPPGMDRWGRRLVEDLGWTKPRAGWYAFSKPLKNVEGES